MTPTERGALALWLLLSAGRSGMTARELGVRLDLRRSGTYALLERLSRVIPIAQYGHRWYVCSLPQARRAFVLDRHDVNDTFVED